MAFVLLGVAVPQPDLQVAFFVASFLLAGYTLLCLFRKDQPEVQTPSDDDKQVILFAPPDIVGDEHQVCPHCGEVYGIGVIRCPRCKRSA